MPSFILGTVKLLSGFSLLNHCLMLGDWRTLKKHINRFALILLLHHTCSGFPLGLYILSLINLPTPLPTFPILSRTLSLALLPLLPLTVKDPHWREGSTLQRKREKCGHAILLLTVRRIRIFF